MLNPLFHAHRFERCVIPSLSVPVFRKPFSDQPLEYSSQINVRAYSDAMGGKSYGFMEFRRIFLVKELTIVLALIKSDVGE